MYAKKSLRKKFLRGVNNCALYGCDMQILRKRVKANSKIKQQQQKLITSQISCPFQKTKLNDKVKIASDKTDIKQLNFKFIIKDVGLLNKKYRSQLYNKEQIQKFAKFA